MNNFVIADCTISVKDDFKPKQPFFKELFLSSQLFPTNGSINLSPGSLLEKCCQEACEVIMCYNGSSYKNSHNVIENKNDWNCYNQHENFLVYETGECLKTGGIKLVAGLNFAEENSAFIPLYDVCFDTETSSPLLVTNTINSSYIYQQPVRDDKWSFHAHLYPGVSTPLERYGKNYSYNTIRTLLGNAELAKSIVDPDSSTKFFAKGHMAPNSNFIFKPEKIVTFDLVSLTHNIFKWIAFL